MVLCLGCDGVVGLLRDAIADVLQHFVFLRLVIVEGLELGVLVNLQHLDVHVLLGVKIDNLVLFFLDISVHAALVEEVFGVVGEVLRPRHEYLVLVPLTLFAHELGRKLFDRAAVLLHDVNVELVRVDGLQLELQFGVVGQIDLHIDVVHLFTVTEEGDEDLETVNEFLGSLRVKQGVEVLVQVFSDSLRLVVQPLTGGRS